MSTLFYVSGAIAIISALLVVTQVNAMHALISLVVMLLAVAAVFFTLGGPFVAVLQIIIYAGAIMVLFVFVIMMLNIGSEGQERERGWLGSVLWVVPAILAAVLLFQFIVTVMGRDASSAGFVVAPKTVGISLFSTYMIGVEIASILLLAALVAAYHLGMLPMMTEGEDD